MLGGIFDAIRISSEGLSAQRKQMDATASNIANIDTTRAKEGGPYQRRRVVMSEKSAGPTFGSVVKAEMNRLSLTQSSHIPEVRYVPAPTGGAGVEAQEAVIRTDTPRMVYDPAHPDADENGYVAYPDVNIVTEMVDMIAASRAYEANVTAINAFKGMVMKALEI